MTAEAALWLIFFLPVGSFTLIALVPPVRRVAGGLTVAAIAGSLVLSLWLLPQVAGAPGHEVPMEAQPWLAVGDLNVSIRLALDGLTVVMLLIVTLVSLLVQVYSRAYMRGDTGYARYFASMSLFTASMLGLVMAGNLLLVYVFWELVGLCSYLLIGHWFQRPSAAAAAKKAFIVTRFGDFGFLLAILVLYTNTGTFDIQDLYTKAALLSAPVLAWAALGVFAGAAGKSAQFPLHVWLPDAMEGPTPVSALIHAATMVAAGVYLVARLFPIFHASPAAMETVALVGGFTAFFAATMGLVMFDIKRVLAYSTISQLGYMMLALGVGGYVAGIFHLFNHALFKALLFLGSGSVSHATGGFDMAKMGGLRRSMPVTFWTFLIASLSLAGIPPLSGFWSKDEILAHTLESPSPIMPLLGFFALATVFLTAFYMTRAVGLTFFGQYRGGEGHALTPGPSPNAGGGEGGHGSGEPHESPAAMTIPLLILGVGAVISWVANAPLALAGLPAHSLEKLLSTPSVEQVAGHSPPFDPLVAGLSTLVALAGIGLASTMYLSHRLNPDTFVRVAPWLHAALVRKYGFDVLFEDLVVRRSLQRVLAGSLDWFDRLIVDGMVNLGGAVPVWLGRGLRPLQSGQVAAYGFSVFFGALVLVVAILLVRLP